jgi:CubicO group peptidase (beta-lactamase class C family)
MAAVTGEGRIRVPADLDAVTAVGHEDPGGLNPAELDRIWDAVRHWYRAGMQPAIQLCLRHNGKVILNRAIGHAWGNGPADPLDAEQIPVTTDTPFCVYSAAKAITTTVVHMLVERGTFSLDDRVCDYLPTYTGHGKERTTIRHVMTHSAGIPFATGPRPDLRRMNDSDYARELLGALKPLHRPGLLHIYHGLTAWQMTFAWQSLEHRLQANWVQHVFRAHL